MSLFSSINRLLNLITTYRQLLLRVMQIVCTPISFLKWFQTMSSFQASTKYRQIPTLLIIKPSSYLKSYCERRPTSKNAFVLMMLVTINPFRKLRFSHHNLGKSIGKTIKKK